ncbi:MAG TPA: NAD(P)/FAD-dependent oxidoreductase [Nocardioides sp.]|nr:NAD(P)/FAD-dependent oxidoreductase [Nocardioides sp.]
MTGTAVWDLVVVGGGPAGSAAALGALADRPGARVLVLDRDEFPRDKSCGDGIAPHVVDVLGPLGAGDVVDGWTPLQRLDLSRGQARVAGHLARPVWVIPREVFDARLVDRAVRAGATLARHRVREVRRDGEVVVVDDAVRARVLVAADGVHSAVRAATGARPTTRRALAIRGYTPTPAAYHGRQVIRFGEGKVPSYAWAFDRGDGQANVGYGEFSRNGRASSRAAMLGRLEDLLPGTVADGSRWRGHHLPLSGWGSASEQPDGPILYAGDAAGLVNPMTGEGIYYAVATGALAGRVAARALREGRPAAAGAAHRRATRRLLGRHLHHTWAASHLIRSPTVVRAGIAAASADRRVFDALVELGLGDGRITPRLVGGLALRLAGH